MDGAFIDGPLGSLRDPRQLFAPEFLSNIDSVLGFRGLLERHDGHLRTTPFVMNLSGSTVLATHTSKVPIANVESAIRLGADAIAFQIHLSDRDEGKMLRMLGRVVGEADRAGLPVMAIAYPRRWTPAGDDNYEEMRLNDVEAYTRLIAHVVRVAVEVGASVVKTVYTGTPATFSEVVEAACGVPVLAAGGRAVEDSAALARAKGAVMGGAWGVAFGRQLVLHREPVRMARALRHAVLESALALESAA